MTEYEIRLHKTDGDFSIAMFTFGFSDWDAKAQARLMLQRDIAYAHVWRGDVLVGSMAALPPGLPDRIQALHEIARELRRCARSTNLPGYAEKMNRAAEDLDRRVADGRWP